MISEETIKQVKESVDIIALVGRYVELKQKGHDFWGCCPFHQEKTPSFKVSPERNTWHCFGCGESGNVITFVMKAEGISFVQAVERLAAFAGIPLDAEALEKSGRELESLFAWLRKNPDIGEFDEVLVAERYIALRSEHETAVKRGKPGWMHTPCKCQALFPLGGKHFFLDLGKHFFPWLGKHFFLLCGKEFFPCDGKYFFP